MGNTKDRIIKFLETTEMNETIFCKNIGISQSMLWFYLHDERDISKKSEDNINNYIDLFKARVQEV
jgi:hypothetical protein